MLTPFAELGRVVIVDLPFANIPNRGPVISPLKGTKRGLTLRSCKAPFESG